MNLGKRLQMAFQLSGMKVPDVARATGVPVTSINALIRRDSKRSEFTEQLLAIVPPNRVSHEWIRSGVGTAEPSKGVEPAASRPKETNNRPVTHMAQAVAAVAKPDTTSGGPLRSWEHPTELPVDGGWVLVPKLGLVRSNTAGKEEMKSVLLIEDVQAFRAEWIREGQYSPAALAWARANDASMETSIYEGDHYVIDTSSREIVDGKTYAISYSGSERPRRLFRLLDGGLRLTALNNNFASIDISAEQARDLQILGRVVHRSGQGGL